MSPTPLRLIPPRLILGSRSPRRAGLLRDAGYRFHQADPPFEDPDQPEADADGPRLAEHLALQKARSLAGALGVGPDHPPAVVLGADTICLDPAGRLVGKPRDADHARAILTAFMGRTHRVISAAALVAIGPTPLTARDEDAGAETTLHDTAEVRMAPLPDAELSAYLASGQWRGKAGGYNLFDRQRAGWSFTVRGDPAAVVGLPMRPLVPALAARGIHPAAHGAARDGVRDAGCRGAGR